ncbi:TM2 domain-containing protein [Aquimarina mytili]|uniref:TM2 domain-containing protein n=1 Tax=Aquimarina mytili TaxID=874423 RepID=A0A936ZZC6_9FLAO|nr:TM2 domain-containing protein [Aquimarina mytili]MBL0683941.1 TM2 domain-containing protein [Aquimarina mytili]
MSEENNNLGDDIKKGAEEAAENVKETAKEFAEEAKEIIDSQDNKKVLAGILAIFLGWLGVHKFILGYQKEGFILLGITLISFPLMCLGIGVLTIYIPSIIGLIEGIMYLTKTDEEFYQTYQVGKKPWF